MLVDGVVDRYQSVPYPVRTAPAGPADFRSRSARARAIRSTPSSASSRSSRGKRLTCSSGSATTSTPMRNRRSRSPMSTVGSAMSARRAVARSIPQLAIWDDHDFGYNNSDGTWPYKAGSLAVFNRYWANPSYGLPASRRVLRVFVRRRRLLLSRRTLPPLTERRPDGPAKTMLGSGQFAWLCERLLASRAPFKVLRAAAAGRSPMVRGATPGPRSSTSATGCSTSSGTAVSTASSACRGTATSAN